MKTLHLTLGAWLALAPMLVAGIELDTVEVQYGEGIYRLQASAWIDAPRRHVFAHLTDYEHLGNLNPAILESRVYHEAGRTIVLTRIRACVLFFCRELERHERIEEENDRRIRTRLLDRGSFHGGTAEWLLHDERDGTRLEYRGSMRPAVFIPPLIGPPLVRERLREELERSLTLLERRCHEWP